MTKKTFYATTPIYYVNASPHIGHAYTTIAADVLTRYHRLRGQNAFLLTGTDEHGQKIERAAEEKGCSAKAFVDEIVLTFTSLWERLAIKYDDFIRTTDERHIACVQAVLARLKEQDDIYLSSYEGWYCTPCETFWPKTQLESAVCPDCERPLEEISETNYFFRLSKYQTWLKEYIETREYCIKPATRRNEILSFLENPLMDLCISRPKDRLKWGIPLPFSEDHVTYVWFDALLNYISALGYPDTTQKFNDTWPCDVHFIGKDILRPHTVYWPIMLHALGLEPARMVFAHGWWKTGEDKMSKSKGNVIDPLDVIEAYGIDGFRYFVLREVPFGLDGTFSLEAFRRRFNTDLANDVGNLLNRTLTMVNKYFEGVIPACAESETVAPLRDIIATLDERVFALVDDCSFSNALETVWELVCRANKFIEEQAPWTLAKEGRRETLASCMYALVESLRVIALELWPFMPMAAERMWQQLGMTAPIDEASEITEFTWGKIPVGQAIQKGDPLFPRLEE